MSRKNRKRRRLAEAARARGVSYQTLRQQRKKPTRGGGPPGYRDALRFTAIRRAIQHSPRHFELRLGALRTPIHVRIERSGPGWRAVADHWMRPDLDPTGRVSVLAALGTAAAFPAAHPAEALRRTVAALAAGYDLAVSAGHRPDEHWLVRDRRFRSERAPRALSVSARRFVSELISTVPRAAHLRAPLADAATLLERDGFFVACVPGGCPTGVYWGAGQRRIVALAVTSRSEVDELLSDLALAVGLGAGADRAYPALDRERQAWRRARIVLRALEPRIDPSQRDSFERRMLRCTAEGPRHSWQILDGSLAGPSPAARLVVEGAGQRCVVKGAPLVIGRDPARADLVLDDPDVEPVHAVVVRRHGSLYLAGFGDAPITYRGIAIRNKRVDHGDEVDICGHTIRCRYHVG